MAGGLAFPNGIAVTGDGLSLLVAETHTGIVHRFDLGAGAQFKERTPFAVLSPAGDGEEEAGPDGMAFGDDGNLYVAHFGAGVVDVVAPSGEVIRSLPSGGPDPDQRRLLGAEPLRYRGQGWINLSTRYRGRRAAAVYPALVMMQYG